MKMETTSQWAPEGICYVEAGYEFSETSLFTRMRCIYLECTEPLLTRVHCVTNNRLSQRRAFVIFCVDSSMLSKPIQCSHRISIGFGMQLHYIPVTVVS